MTDVNGTRFHLVLGREDWERLGVSNGQPLATVFANAHDPAVSWDPTRRELTLGTRVAVFRTAVGNRAPDFADRRGAAADRFGDIYSVSKDKRDLLVGDDTVFWSSGGGQAILPVQGQAGSPVLHRRGSFGPSESEPPAPPLELRGVAVTNDGYLFTGVVEPKGMLLFDLHVGGPPRQFFWPDDLDFEPFDVAALPGGGVAILDRAHRRAWLLDRALGICAPADLPRPIPRPEPFQSIDADAPRVLPSFPEPTIFDSIELEAVNPIAIEALGDGSILVLDTPPGADFSRVTRYVEGVKKGETLETRPRAEGVPLRAFDCAVVAGEAGLASGVGPPGGRGAQARPPRSLKPDASLSQDVLYIVPEAGDQAFAFDVVAGEGDEWKLRARPDFAPMRLFTGKAMVAHPEGPWYDSANRWTPLVARHRGQYVERGSVVIAGLDGKEPDCVWHRLFLDACVPRDCRISVRTRAANEKAQLALAPWSDEPPLIRRAQGSELPWSWSTAAAGIDTWELLFQRARGRWLDVELTLHGTGRATPRIRAARAWYPRFSYLERYLPRVYRADGESASFVDRFLSLFEGFFTSVEDRIAAVQLLLDIDGAPPDVLEWLAGWFGVALDPAWDDGKRRLFLRYAAEFFEWRGTPGGLLAALRLVLDDCVDESTFAFGGELPRSGVRIIEHFRGRPANTAAHVTGETFNPESAGAVSAVSDEAPDVPASIDDPRDEELWNKYVLRQYSRLDELNDTFGSEFKLWREVSVSAADAVDEWRNFESLVVPFRERAHRFSVVIPVEPGSSDAERKMDLVRRVVALEKPAHTVFDVDFYWTWFRLGEARVGEDTVVDLGSRAPFLLAPFEINRTRIGGGYLAPDASRIGAGRIVLGRSCARAERSTPSAGDSE